MAIDRETPASSGRPQPRTTERNFGIEEIFFSTTDAKGLISSGNQIFTRVSGYERPEMIGKPHNLIRHPDMPRAVFKLLWTEIEAGRPVAAYVKNLAKDGQYYWVVAVVVPVHDGFLSVRIKPSTPILAAVEGIYRDLCAFEHDFEQGDFKRRKGAIEASTARLHQLIEGAGWPSYDAFMRNALLAEVKNRDALIGRSARSRLAALPEGANPQFAKVLTSCAEINDVLDRFVGRLDAYFALNQHLATQAEFIQGLAGDIRLFSLNAQLAATRVQGEGGAALGAVASIMRSRSDASGPVFDELTAAVSASIHILETMFFPVAATKLQAEVAMVFIHDLIDGAGRVEATAEDLGALAFCLASGVDTMITSLDELDDQIRALRSQIDQLTKDLYSLRALETIGKIEAARAGAKAFNALFASIGAKINEAYSQLEELSGVSRLSVGEDATTARRTRIHVDAVRDAVARVLDRALSLAA